MAKKSRRAQRAAAADATTQASSPWERYRLWIIGAGAVAVVAIVGYMFLSAATTSAYTCDELLEAPTDRTVDAEDAAGFLGFVVNDEGREHSDGSVRYATCPPTSGDHRGGGALEQGYYGPGREQVPNDWVHNLEHGYAVIAYAGDPGGEMLSQIRETIDSVEPSEVAIACNLPNKVLAVRFDQMSEPFAVLAWDRALLMSTYDPDLVGRAATQFQDLQQSPERAC